MRGQLSGTSVGSAMLVWRFMAILSSSRSTYSITKRRMVLEIKISDAINHQATATTGPFDVAAVVGFFT